MKSYPRRGSSGFRVTVGVMSLGIALFFSGMAHAAPQYSLSCIDCHQMPPLDSATGARVPGTGAFKGNHQQHAGATAESCVKCHGAAVTDYPTSHRTKQIRVNGNINSSPAIGAYSRGFFNQTSIPPAALGSCTNVNCHFESTTDPWGVLPASTYTQVGANGTTCGKCHAAPPSDGNHPSAAPGPGKKHGDYFGTGTGSCIKCHPDHGVEPAPFSHATSAGKRGLVLQFTAAPNSGGTYSGDVSYPHYLPSQNPARNGNCSNLYCHSDGRGGAPKTTPTWGTTLPADCTGCHGGNATTGANAMSTYQHQKHINNAGYIGTNYACGRCHSNTVDPANDQAITASGVSTYHVNGTPNVVFNNGGTYGGGTCSATLCHSAGKSAAPQPLVPSWTAGGSLDCKGCHGIGGNNGEPSYTSGGVAADLANSHTVKHVKNAASCANCHANTTADGVSIKPGSTTHTNGGIDVNFAATYDLGGAQYNGAINTKTCASIYCHSDGNGGAPNQTPQWGGSTTCTSCHGNDYQSPVPIATGKHRAHLNNYTTLGRNNYFGCAECHGKTVSDNHTIAAGSTSHVNKMKDYSGARAGKIAVANSGKCSTNYCHSTGAKNNTFWNMTAANWYSSRTLGCTGCHGNASSPDFAPVAGTPNYANVTSAANTARNSHNKHVPGAGITDTTGCAKCHYRTVDAAIPGKLRNYSTQHLNGVRDVSFSAAASISGVQGRYSSTTQQCMNTYCHGGPKTPKWGSSSLACNQCHSADSTGFGANAGAHGAHYQVATPPAAGTYASMPAGEGSLATQTSYQFNCTSCHSSPATH
ncbi:MAG TPA: CxxxxCH/CxxCH domain-containing protein, partial [Geobacteraceae bacterium]